MSKFFQLAANIHKIREKSGEMLFSDSKRIIGKSYLYCVCVLNALDHFSRFNKDDNSQILVDKEAKKPICDIAANHMARKTFIGNLYKKILDLKY